jgi:hypothetical protein
MPSSSANEMLMIKDKNREIKNKLGIPIKETTLPAFILRLNIFIKNFKKLNRTYKEKKNKTSANKFFKLNIPFKKSPSPHHKITSLV